MAEERTIEEWLQELPDGYRERALENRITQGAVDAGAYSLANAIDRGFTWAYTPEGGKFWMDVCEAVRDGASVSLYPLLPATTEPEAESVNKPEQPVKKLPAEVLKQKVLEAISGYEAATGSSVYDLSLELHTSTTFGGERIFERRVKISLESL